MRGSHDDEARERLQVKLIHIQALLGNAINEAEMVYGSNARQVRVLKVAERKLYEARAADEVNECDES